MPILVAGPATVSVDLARGARLSSLVVHGHEVLTEPEPGSTGAAADPLRWGSFPMAPFAGRVRDGRFAWDGHIQELTPNFGGHAMHGTVFDRAWTVESQASGSLRLRADLQPGWPYAGWAAQEATLGATRLDLRLEVHTTGPAFPATLGWHPWFRRRVGVGGALEVALDAGRYYPRDLDGLPVGSVEAPPADGPWDDCFTAVAWPVVLTWPGALELSMSSTCDHVVLFDETSHAICVEPQTGPPNALNHPEQATIVRPGHPLTAEMSLTWSVPGS